MSTSYHSLYKNNFNFIPDIGTVKRYGDEFTSHSIILGEFFFFFLHYMVKLIAHAPLTITKNQNHPNKLLNKKIFI